MRTITAVQIENATEEVKDSKGQPFGGYFKGSLDGFHWTIDRAPCYLPNTDGRFRIDIRIDGNPGSSRYIATRAKFESIADRIAKFINSQNKEQAK